jgi:hypothetical protein
MKLHRFWHDVMSCEKTHETMYDAFKGCRGNDYARSREMYWGTPASTLLNTLHTHIAQASRKKTLKASICCHHDVILENRSSVTTISTLETKLTEKLKTISGDQNHLKFA